MLVNFNQVIKNLRGAPITMDGEPLTIKFAVITALLNTYADEPDLSGAEKAHRFQLACGIDNGLQDVGPADRDLIRVLVGKTFGPPIVGPVFGALLEEAGADLAISGAPVTEQAFEAKLTKALKKTMKARAEAGMDELPKRKRGRA